VTAQLPPSNQINTIENIHTVVVAPDSNSNEQTQRSKEQSYEQMSKEINDDIANAFTKAVQQEYSNITIGKGASPFELWRWKITEANLLKLQAEEKDTKQTPHDLEKMWAISFYSKGHWRRVTAPGLYRPVTTWEKKQWQQWARQHTEHLGYDGKVYTPEEWARPQRSRFNPHPRSTYYRQRQNAMQSAGTAEPKSHKKH